MMWYDLQIKVMIKTTYIWIKETFYLEKTGDIKERREKIISKLIINQMEKKYKAIYSSSK